MNKTPKPPHPQILDYHRPIASRNATHDKIYTALLGILGLLLAVGFALLCLSNMHAAARGAKWSSLIPEFELGLLPIAMFMVTFIRLFFPDYGRLPTIALNVIFLFFIPFGTVLGVYGLWKVDKELRGESPRSVKLIGFGIFALFLITFIFLFFQGEIVMMLNPKYSEKNLTGLTLTQVIQRLGSPDVDSGESPYLPPGGGIHQQRSLVYEFAHVGRTIYFIDDKVTGMIWDR